MRRGLDALYDAAAYLAALFLVGTLVMVLLGIFGRLLSFQVRGTDAYSGYLMAGAGFLALAHTLMRGEHIRVTLVLEHAGVAGKRLTPFLLARLADVTAGRSIRANRALALNNARVAAEIAVAIAADRA